jgi:prepilin signal peptidase PulO-like enzyme (type II secretory pathway)
MRRYHRIRYGRSFPTLAVIILVFALAWLLRELDVIDIKLPWLPVILILIVIGIIFNRLIG